MGQRTALFLSVGLTAFLLVAIGAVAAVAAQQAEGVGPAPAVELPPEIEAEWQVREAEYQQALEQANVQLAEAYETIAASGIAEPPAEPQTAVYPVSAELAVGLALNLAPGSELRHWPELVDFRGTVAYEVLLDGGPVYISATDAILLYNGASSPPADDGGSYGEHDGDDDDEHEDEHEDEDEDSG
ncbi:MAG TPA: hypothetical protein VGA52_02875 [Anaerolineales bacterium]|jgi:hypothetical protein